MLRGGCKRKLASFYFPALHFPLFRMCDMNSVNRNAHSPAAFILESALSIAHSWNKAAEQRWPSRPNKIDRKARTKTSRGTYLTSLSPTTIHGTGHSHCERFTLAVQGYYGQSTSASVLLSCSMPSCGSRVLQSPQCSELKSPFIPSETARRSH
jgi:hypothetical protein